MVLCNKRISGKQMIGRSFLLPLPLPLLSLWRLLLLLLSLLFLLLLLLFLLQFSLPWGLKVAHIVRKVLCIGSGNGSGGGGAAVILLRHTSVLALFPFAHCLSIVIWNGGSTTIV